MRNIKRPIKILFLIFSLLTWSMFVFVAIAEEGVLKPGDTVEISVKRQPALSRVLNLGNAGWIAFPLIGKLKASGMTTAQLEKELQNRLAVYIKKPIVTVNKTAAGERGVVTTARSDGVMGSMATRVINLHYARASSVKESVQGIVSEVGSIYADEATNSLIATDLPANLGGLERIIRQLDVYGPERRQVLIEAQIIEVKADFEKELGVRWFVDRLGGKKFLSASYDKSINLPPLPTELTTQEHISGASIVSGQERTTIPNVGLATLAKGASFFYGEIFRNYDINAVIDALVTENKADLLACPKIVVENEQEAKIEIVAKLPFRTLTGTAVGGQAVYTTDFVDVGVVLKVTPSIKKEEIVNMQLEPEVSFIQGEREDIPIKVSRKTNTHVNVKDGATLVIGGLLQDRKVSTQYKVPILGDIPLLGLLFKTKSDQIEKTELMIFITPHILTEEKAKEITEEGMNKMEDVRK